MKQGTWLQLLFFAIGEGDDNEQESEDDTFQFVTRKRPALNANLNPNQQNRHVGFSLPGWGGGSVEPPKTGGGGSGKGLN